MGGSVGAGEGGVAVGDEVAATGVADGAADMAVGRAVVGDAVATVAVVGEEVATEAVVGVKEIVGLVLAFATDGAAVNPAPTGAPLLVALLVLAAVGALLTVGMAVPEGESATDGANDAPLLVMVGTSVSVALAVGAKDETPGGSVVKGGSVVVTGVVVVAPALAAVMASCVMLQKLSKNKASLLVVGKDTSVAPSPA